MFNSLRILGNLISEELLLQVAEGAAPGQQATDFSFEPGTRLSNEIEYAWSRIRLEWKRFVDKRENLPATDPYGTTLARRWMEDFFKTLGFELDRHNQALEGGNGQRYSISNTATSPAGLPVHIVGFVHPDTAPGKEINTLDLRSSGGKSRLSPHSTVQEYLNVTNHLYGLVTNGLQLRLLRDSGRLVKFTYIEFDLRFMLEQDQYADFTLLYRLLHCSRFGNTADTENCWLEQYYLQSIETGNRIRNGLSKAVKEALMALGNGFIGHPDNEALRQAIANGTLSGKDFYRELLRLIYRLLFLLVTEERDLVYNPEDKSDETARYRNLYRQFYSLARLRRLSEHRYLHNEAYTDLWPALQATFRLFEADGNGQHMGIQPLGSDLFSASATPHLATCTLANRLLLECLRNMNEFTDPESRSLVAINYRALDVEELGSVYEGLLDLHPVVQSASHAAEWSFTFHEGTDRKTTGSYYTRPDLVNELIKSALIPVIEKRLKQAAGQKIEQEKSLLSLKVCDAAAGSGHMLLAAARTIAWYLARVRSGEDNPSLSTYRSCLREVIQHCIYAVDMNPDAVELCKLALWLESHNSGKPLSFLDHKIRCGNSLVGVTDLSVLKKGIPDAAFNPVTGDDKDVCKELKSVNNDFTKKKQYSLFDFESGGYESQNLSNQYHELEEIKQNDIEEVEMVREKYESLRKESVWSKDWISCNLWTSAFFMDYSKENKNKAVTSEQLDKFHRDGFDIYDQVVKNANQIAFENKFFHWPLEFPDVFEQGGFDVVLSNPPWEKIKVQEVEFFTSRDVAIAKAENKSERAKLIKKLPEINPALFHEFQNALHFSECQSKFIRHSSRFELTGVGDINTYAVFSEHFYTIINVMGRMSIIVPTGIATDENTSLFFRTIVENGQLESFWGYKNEKFLFPKPVEHTVTFGILTVSSTKNINRSHIDFCWLAYTVEEANDPRRRIKLSKEDLATVNPNTLTAPICRTKEDLELLIKIYRSNNILNIDGKENRWRLAFQRMYDMASDSGHFRNKKTLEGIGFNLKGNKFLNEKGQEYIPLYESKMIREFDHRFGSYEGFESRTNTMLPTPTPIMYASSSHIITPWYWVDKTDSLLRASNVPEIVKKSFNKGLGELKKALVTWVLGFYLTENNIAKKEEALKLANSFGVKKREKELLALALDIINEFPLDYEQSLLIEQYLNSCSVDIALKLIELRSPKWLFGFRNVARSTDERTAIFTIIPFSAVGHSMPLLTIKNQSLSNSLILVSNFFTIVFDWIVRQKVAGVNFSYFYIKQLAIINDSIITDSLRNTITRLVLELIYTSWDIKPFADQVWMEADDNVKQSIQQQWDSNKIVTGGHEWAPPEWAKEPINPYHPAYKGCPLSPFKWDEERRAVLKAELDAIYAKLYGLTIDELRYILDPQDVYGPNFPSETFRVLKEKEIRQYGEYRTRKLVLEAWERLS